MAVSLSIPAQDYTTHACNITVNGLPLSADYQIVSAQIRHGFQYIGSLNITFKIQSNIGSDPLANPLSIPVSGTKISLNAKLDFEDIELFNGIVVSHQFKNTAQGSRLIVQAKNKAVSMAVTKKPEVFNSQSDKDIVEGLVNEHNLSFEANNILGLFLLKNTQLVKNELSDWDFVNIRAEANGTFIFTEGDKVILEKPLLGVDPLKIVKAQYGNNVFELHQKQDDRQLQTLYEWNALDLQNHEAQATAEEAPINLSLLEPIQGKNQQAYYRQYNEQEIANLKTATSQLKELSKASGTANIKANLVVKPGYTLEVAGFNSSTDGQYIITEVMHEYGQGGFNTFVQYGFNHEDFCSKFGIKSSFSSPSVYLGIVTSLEADPENLNRIRIRIPTFYNDPELWARMAQPYASNQFGMQFLPEKDDEVLVSFLGNDMDYPVVVGSLYSVKNPPPLPASDDNHEKIMQTRFGMKWYWNDEKGIHEISTPAGNKIVLSEDTKTITITDQSQNKIEMTETAIEIEGSKDINIKATANVKIEGVNINLEASGMLTLKGSLVQIN